MPIQATDLDAGNANGYSFSADNTTYVIKSGVVVTSNFTAVYDNGFGSCRLVNYGSIVAGTGMYATADQILITNGETGEISATSCISVGEGSNTVVNNHGMLAGLFEGINVSSSGRTTILNTGTISATYAIEGSDSGDVFIDNTGTVVGDFYSIDVLGTESIRVNNSGTLTGDVWLEGNFTEIHNSGTISGNIILGDFDDRYFGKGGNVTGVIQGRDGDDRLIAGNGGEIFAGGLGNDILTGGRGDDTFRFDHALNSATNVDAVRKFSSGDDTFELENFFFVGLKEGYLAAGAFKLIANASSTQGVDGNDRILYDKARGDLYFDQDGSGAVFGREKFAHLNQDTEIGASDFLVI